MQQHITHSETETESIALQWAKHLQPGDIVALLGCIGMGKTVFVRGLCAGLGYAGRVTSPTFNLLHEYRQGGVCIRHYDLYRINNAEELEQLGFYDGLDDCITVIEWSERVLDALPQGHKCVQIERVDDNTRRITIL